MQIRDFRRTQCLLLAFAIFGMPSGFAQQANVPAATVASAPSQNANADSQTKAIEKDGIYEVGGPVKPPKLVHTEDAEFPESARHVGFFHHVKLNKTCVLTMVVDANGKQQDIKVTRSAGADFDKSALTAVKTYVFKPATLNGKPVPVHLTVEIEFHRY